MHRLMVAHPVDFRTPAEPFRPREADIIASTDKPLSGRRILVVEDEMLILMDAEDMLADLGCESVTGAATTEEALALIKLTRFDAALLDLNLGGDRSFSIADALASDGVPFAYATGYGRHGLRLADCGRAVLTKPYQPAELVATLAALWRH